MRFSGGKLAVGKRSIGVLNAEKVYFLHEQRCIFEAW